MTKMQRTERISDIRKRLDAYKTRELEMLTGGVQSYGISSGTGSRNLSRYNTDLAAVRKAIKELQEELDELTAEEEGQKPRKAVGVVIRDW